MLNEQVQYVCNSRRRIFIDMKSVVCTSNKLKFSVSRLNKVIMFIQYLLGITIWRLPRKTQLKLRY